MEKRNIIKPKNKNTIKNEDFKILDNFIQKCLDRFKFIEPKKELYESTGEHKNIIISHKSTIPDLVIWNKTFNKNNCFIGADTSKHNEFPRFLFYIKIKKNKKSKNIGNSSKKNNNNKNNINNSDIDLSDNYSNLSKTNSVNSDNNNINKININSLNNNIENNSYESNKNYNYSNAFNIIENQLFNNKNNILNLTIYLIQLYLYKNGWIILTKDEHFSGPGTSIDLFQFLQEKIKENINLNDYTIIDINKQVKYCGQYFFILLSNTLPNILQKKQLEYIKFENIMNKHFLISNYNNINNLNYNNYLNNEKKDYYKINNNLYFKENNNIFSNIINYNGIKKINNNINIKPNYILNNNSNNFNNIFNCNLNNRNEIANFIEKINLQNKTNLANDSN